MCLAVPGRIECITPGDEPIFRQGQVSFGGVTRQVSLACVPEATVGDYVLVHAGIAISCIDEAAARETLAYLESIDELDELQEPAE